MENAGSMLNMTKAICTGSSMSRKLTHQPDGRNQLHPGVFQQQYEQYRRDGNVNRRSGKRHSEFAH